MIAAHVIFGAYGFWLPNDPRGSWSDFVGSYELYRFGPATTTAERHSLAYAPHDHRLRLAAKTALERSAVQFNDAQRQAVGDGIGKYVAEAKLSIWACAVLRDHVHLVIAATSMDIPQRVIQLKGSATETLVARGIHPFQSDVANGKRPPKCFARGEWIVFLDTLVDVERAIDYAERNPEKEGLPRQHWDFVTPWAGGR